MLRYMRGSNIDLPRLGGTDLEESSRDIELAYVVQSGSIKGLALRGPSCGLPKQSECRFDV
jgi:hypothetical protein